MNFRVISLIFFSVLPLSMTIAGNLKPVLNEDKKWPERIKEYEQEVTRIETDAILIHETLDVYHLDVVEEEYNRLTTSLDQVKHTLAELKISESTVIKNQFYDLYESIVNSYDKLVTLYDFYRQLENKKEEWSNQYFRLWEQTYDLKTRVERVYVKEEKMNVHYGGLSDYKYKSVYKRNLYESCNSFYNASLLNLKSTGDCDHYQRILILEKVIPVLRKCEKLSAHEETRSLEKELRKTDDPEKIEQLILSFPFED